MMPICWFRIFTDARITWCYKDWMATDSNGHQQVGSITICRYRLILWSFWVMLPTYWFSVWWCFWGAPVASVSISCPSCSATEGVVRNGKSTAGHQRYLCSHCRKTWQLQFTYTASQPGTHQKIIDMAMNGVGCRATARIMGVGLNTIFRHLKNSGRSR